MTTCKDICEKHCLLMWPEAQILKKCAAMLPADPIIINIGAGAGTSAIAMLEERPDAFVFSVDHIPEPLELENLLACGVDPTRCVRLLGISWDIGRNFPYPVHMVFVDGAHYSEAVEQDIATWLPRILPGGIMAFHDYKNPNVPELAVIVNSFMDGNKIIDEHRYMIAFEINDKDALWRNRPS